MTGRLCYHHIAGINKDDLQRATCKGESGQICWLGSRSGAGVETEVTKKAVIADESGM